MRNIKYKFTARAVYSDGEIIDRYFCTKTAYRNYVHSCYQKDNDVTVYIFKYSPDMTDYNADDLITTYHA